MNRLRSLFVLLFTFGKLFGQNQSHNEKLSLSEAIETATKSNPEILAAQKEIDAASGRVLQAGRIANPELSVQYNLAPTNFDIGKAQEKDISLSQSFEFPGKRGARIDVAVHEKAINEYAAQRLQALVTTRVTQAYLRTLLSNAVVDNLGFTIALLEDFLKVVTERYQAGASTYLDVLRTKVELTRLQNERVEAERELYQREAELNILLGRSGDAALRLTDSLAYQPFDLPPDSAMALYERRSAYLKIVERGVARGESRLGLAEKSYLPDFSLGAALQHRPGAISSAGSSRYLGLELGVSIPLWFWQGPKGEVQEAQASLDISALRLESARRLVQQRILAAYRSVQSAKKQFDSFTTSLLQDAEDELRSGIAAYQNNQIDVLNLFDIYRINRATKIEYTRTLFNYLAARAELASAAEVAE